MPRYKDQDPEKSKTSLPRERRAAEGYSQPDPPDTAPLAAQVAEPYGTEARAAQGTAPYGTEARTAAGTPARMGPDGGRRDRRLHGRGGGVETASARLP
jgi:hypothetical protein